VGAGEGTTTSPASTTSSIMSTNLSQTVRLAHFPSSGACAKSNSHTLDFPSTQIRAFIPHLFHSWFINPTQHLAIILDYANKLHSRLRGNIVTPYYTPALLTVSDSKRGVPPTVTNDYTKRRSHKKASSTRNMQPRTSGHLTCSGLQSCRKPRVVRRAIDDITRGSVRAFFTSPVFPQA